MCLALLEAAVVVMNTENWSLPVSLSSFYFSSAPILTPPNPIILASQVTNIKVLVDIDKWERSWENDIGEKGSLYGAVLEPQLSQARCPEHLKIPLYLNCWDNVIVNVLVNVNSIYLIVLVCGRRKEFEKQFNNYSEYFSLIYFVHLQNMVGLW